MAASPSNIMNESAICLPCHNFFVSFRRPKNNRDHSFVSNPNFSFGSTAILCVEYARGFFSPFLSHRFAHGIHSAVQPPVGAGKLGVSASQGKRVCGPQAQ